MNGWDTQTSGNSVKGQLGLYVLHDESLKALHDDGCKCDRAVVTEAVLVTWNWVWIFRLSVSPEEEACACGNQSSYSPPTDTVREEFNSAVCNCGSMAPAVSLSFFVSSEIPFFSFLSSLPVKATDICLPVSFEREECSEKIQL